MATERKAITVYLPDKLVQYITQYCTSNEVVGKNKDGKIVPRLATGIVDLLKIVANTPVDELSTNDTIAKNEVETIKKQLAIIEDRLNNIENKTSNVHNRVLDLENTGTVLNKDLLKKTTSKTTLPEAPEEEEDIGTTKGTITPEKENKPLKGNSRRAKSKDKADTVKSADKPTHDGKIDDNVELVLSQNKLATRLGYKNHGHLATKFKKLSRQEFINWTKSKDPESKGWYKTGKGFRVVTN